MWKSVGQFLQRVPRVVCRSLRDLSYQQEKGILFGSSRPYCKAFLLKAGVRAVAGGGDLALDEHVVN